LITPLNISLISPYQIKDLTRGQKKITMKEVAYFTGQAKTRKYESTKEGRNITKDLIE